MIQQKKKIKIDKSLILNPDWILIIAIILNPLIGGPSFDYRLKYEVRIHYILDGK